MATSDIKISALTAAGGVKSVALLAVWDNSLTGSCLGYMQPAKYRWYASQTNSKPSTPIAETVLPLFTHTGLADAATWFYWAAAVDSAGNEGAAFPSGGGRQAITSAASASAVDLANAIVDYNAKVTQEKTERVAQDGSLASQITAVTATATDAQTKATLATADARIEFSANVGSGGAASSIDLKATRTVGGVKQTAGLRISTPASGLPSVDITAAQLRLLNSLGTPVFLVNSDGTLAAQTVKATNVIADNIIVTTQVQANQITAIETTPGNNLTINTTVNQNLGNIITDVIAVPANQTEQMLFIFHCDQSRPEANSANVGGYSFAIYDNNVLIPGSAPAYFYDDNFVSNPLIMTAKDLGPGSHTINVQCAIVPSGGLAKFNLSNLFLSILRCKR